VQSLQAPDFQRVHARDVQSVAAADSDRVAGHERDLHLRAPAAVTPQRELDRMRDPDPLFRHLDVVGDGPQVVLGTGVLAFAADRDPAVELAGHEPADAPFAQIERLVELQRGAARRLQDHRRPVPLRLVGRGPVGRVDDRAGAELHGRAGLQVDVLLHEQLELVALQDLRALVDLPVARLEHLAEPRQAIDRQQRRRAGRFGSRRGWRLDLRHQHERVRPVRDQHDRKTRRDADDPTHRQG